MGTFQISKLKLALKMVCCAFRLNKPSENVQTWVTSIFQTIFGKFRRFQAKIRLFCSKIRIFWWKHGKTVNFNPNLRQKKANFCLKTSKFPKIVWNMFVTHVFTFSLGLFNLNARQTIFRASFNFEIWKMPIYKGKWFHP